MGSDSRLMSYHLCFICEKYGCFMPFTPGERKRGGGGGGGGSEHRLLSYH